MGNSPSKADHEKILYDQAIAYSPGSRVSNSKRASTGSQQTHKINTSPPNVQAVPKAPSSSSAAASRWRSPVRSQESRNANGDKRINSVTFKATTNENLIFEMKNFEKLFPKTSIRDGFANHKVYKKTYREPQNATRNVQSRNRVMAGLCGDDVDQKELYEGLIVAISEDMPADDAGGSDPVISSSGMKNNDSASSSSNTNAKDNDTDATSSPKTNSVAVAQMNREEVQKRLHERFSKSKSVKSPALNENPVVPQSPIIPKGNFSAPTRNGLIGSIMTAYNYHCDLVLAPDDIWIAILGQFCAYVNANAEKLRDMIVEFEGKKELEVKSGGCLHSADYINMIKDMLKEIQKNIKSPELADWFLPNFTTTTLRDEVAACATAMATLQAYFDYKMCICCGIPNVTMLGSSEDWKKIRTKIDYLLNFDLDSKEMTAWLKFLIPVCDMFVKCVENPNSEEVLQFWDRTVSHHGGGSGPTYISGWVSTFTVFDKDGKWQGSRFTDTWGNTAVSGSKDAENNKFAALFPMIDTDDINHNVVSVPVNIDDNGVPYDGTLFSGQVCFEVEFGKTDERYPTIRPRNDWCMAVAIKDSSFTEISEFSNADVNTPIIDKSKESIGEASPCSTVISVIIVNMSN